MVTVVVVSRCTSLINSDSITNSDNRDTRTIREMVKESKAVDKSGPLKKAKVCIQYAHMSLWRNHKTEETRNPGTIIPPINATTFLPDIFTIRTKLIIIGIKRKKKGVYSIPAQEMKKEHRKVPDFVPEIKAVYTKA